MIFCVNKDVDFLNQESKSKAQELFLTWLNSPREIAKSLRYTSEYVFNMLNESDLIIEFCIEDQAVVASLINKARWELIKNIPCKVKVPNSGEYLTYTATAAVVPSIDDVAHLADFSDYYRYYSRCKTTLEKKHLFCESACVSRDEDSSGIEFSIGMNTVWEAIVLGDTNGFELLWREIVSLGLKGRVWTDIALAKKKPLFGFDKHGHKAILEFLCREAPSGYSALEMQKGWQVVSEACDHDPEAVRSLLRWQGRQGFEVAMKDCSKFEKNQYGMMLFSQIEVFFQSYPLIHNLTIDEGRRLCICLENEFS